MKACIERHVIIHEQHSDQKAMYYNIRHILDDMSSLVCC